MGPLPAWRVPPAAVFHWRHWDQESVVYHEQSGDTHRLNATGAQVLMLLAERPMTAGELFARLSTAPPDVTAPIVDLPTIESLLADFRDLGLIEPAP